MNAVIVLLLGFAVAIFGYRVYAKRIDSRIIKADPKRATPAKMYMDGVEFMPTSKNILFGYQFKSIAGAAPIIGPIIAIQWGWLPALIWILGGALFIGWVQDYSSAMMAMRNDGASFGGLSHKLISPRARGILLSFIYFYLLLIAGAFGNVVVSTAIGLKAAPMAWLFMTIGGILAGQMIYRWKKDIILTTVVCVVIALFGIYLGSVFLRTNSSARSFPPAVHCGRYWRSSSAISRRSFLSGGSPCQSTTWRPTSFSWGCSSESSACSSSTPTSRCRPTTFSIPIGPMWPIMFVTIACGAISGWHSIVSSSGTARQLENEIDARPVGAGVMFVEMMLALFALIIAGTLYAAPQYADAIKGPGAIFAGGTSNSWEPSASAKLGSAYGSVMMIVLAITIMQLVIRFMRVATSELLSDVNPVFRNPHVGTFVACLLGIIWC